MKILCFILAVAFALTGLAADPPRKIVFLAGAPDAGHPAGTHEYAKAARLLADSLERSSNLKDIAVEVHENGWPQNPKSLDDAATIVLICSGADRQREAHPLLVGDRMDLIARQMQRGCGLVVIHWGVFVPNDGAGERFLDWIGGYFDYQSGPPEGKWYSRITTADYKPRPASPTHPICHGVEPFAIQEEFYYRIRFRENDKRLTPILSVAVPNEKEEYVVGWAVERADGGRGFGFTGGHFFKNYAEPNFLRLLQNAIVWTAKADVPTSGVAMSDPKWTPPPSTDAKAEPWELQGDRDWIDDRFQKMDTGQFQAHSVKVRGGELVPKGIAIRIGDKNEAAILFDTNLLRVVAGWTGDFLKQSNARFSMMGSPEVAGQIQFTSPALPGWTTHARLSDPRRSQFEPLPREFATYRGLHLHGKRVVLRYLLGGSEILESPWAESKDGVTAITRTFTLAQRNDEWRMLVGTASGDAQITSDSVRVDRDGNVLAAVLRGENKARFEVTDGRIELVISPQETVTHLKLLCWSGTASATDKFFTMARSSSAPQDLRVFLRGGPRRWGEPLVTRGKRAADDAAFAVDTLAVPYKNPWNALMFISGLDFLPDGRIAVCTMHGDVWLVGGADKSLERLTWKRFATGLYQPLGVKVVSGKIHVVCRDQIVELEDLNGDDEADHYFCKSNQIQTAGSGHAYAMSLETDSQGNFYVVKSDDGGAAQSGAVVRVSPDGARCDIIATGHRHPNGLGVGPDGTITTADNEGNWVPATRINQVREGGFYGHMPTHGRHIAPKTYDEPLCWLPRAFDNSAGGQVWTPPKMWGPLGGSLLHFSYGRCTVNLVLREQVEGQWQGGATVLPLKFLSGAMRGRFGRDGALYVGGLRGWQNAAVEDGHLQRVRYTGKPILLPRELNVRADGIRISFHEPLDAKTASDPANYTVKRWNYRWSGDYGSKRYSVADPARVGEDDMAIKSARLLDDRTVFLEIADLRPVMQMETSYKLRSRKGETIEGVIYHTVHRLGAAGK